MEVKIISEIKLVLKSTHLALTLHESMTCLTPGIVKEVSAIFVDKIIFLHPSFVGAKTFCWTETCCAA